MLPVSRLNMKKTALFVSHSAELYGAERVLLQSLAGLDRARFRPLLLMPADGPFRKAAEERDIPVRVIPFKWWLTEPGRGWKQPLSWIWNIRSIFRISRLISEEAADLVLTNSSVQFSGALAARLKKVPHIWWIHELLEPDAALVRFLLGQRTLIRMIERLSAKILVNSEATARPFKNKGKVRKVLSGLELPSEPSRPDPALRESLGFAAGDFLVGVIGKLYPAKCQLPLVEALDILRQEIPRVKLLLVGEVRDRGYHRRILRFVASKRMEGSVAFLGYQEDIQRVLAGLDLLVIPSPFESFGRSALEAMAVWTPVLAVRGGGIEDIIDPEITGFLVEDQDPRSLARAIRSLLRDPERMRRVVEPAYRKLQEKFSVEEQVRKTQAVMEECLQE